MLRRSIGLIACTIGGLSCKRDSQPTPPSEPVTLNGPVKVIKVIPAPKPTTFPSGEDDVRCDAPLVRKSYKLPFGSSVFCAQGEDGRQHGPFASFDAAGKLVSYGQMRDGKRDGVWTNFGPDGKPTTLEEYADGELARKSPAR